MRKARSPNTSTVKLKFIPVHKLFIYTCTYVYIHIEKFLVLFSLPVFGNNHIGYCVNFGKLNSGRRKCLNCIVTLISLK